MNSLCQECFNFKCPWHERFEEVKGWCAVPTKLKTDKGKVIESVLVITCPLYKTRGQESWQKITLAEIAGIIQESVKSTAKKIRSGKLNRVLAGKGYDFMRITMGDEKIRLREQYFVRKMN